MPHTKLPKALTDLRRQVLPFRCWTYFFNEVKTLQECSWDLGRWICWILYTFQLQIFKMPYNWMDGIALTRHCLLWDFFSGFSTTSTFTSFTLCKTSPGRVQNANVHETYLPPAQRCKFLVLSPTWNARFVQSPSHKPFCDQSTTMSIHTTGLGAPVVGLEVGGASQRANRMARKSKGGAEFLKRWVFTFQPVNHASSWIDKRKLSWYTKTWVVPFPSNSGKWRFPGFPYKKCNIPGGDYYWRWLLLGRGTTKPKLRRTYNQQPLWGWVKKSHVTSTIFIQKCLLRYPPRC